MHLSDSQGPGGLRSVLRGLPVLQHPAPATGTHDAPPEPYELFEEWFTTAVDAAVIEPHAMVLSTVDADGLPDARALILKDVRDGAWWFATDATTAKAAQLAANPVAALTFYWPTLGRQVRLRGTVRFGTGEENRQDFRDRGATSRAAVVAATAPLPATSREEFADQVAALLVEATVDPDLGSDAWLTYGLEPVQVEFWEADPDRLHRRLVYRRTDGGWECVRLPH